MSEIEITVKCEDEEKKANIGRFIKFFLANSGELIETAKNIVDQDNCCTAEPVFMVQNLNLIPAPEDNHDSYVWAETESDDYAEASEDHAESLDIMEEFGISTGKWKKFYHHEKWENVQPFFTRESAKCYLDIQGHNLGKTRIYADGSFRNSEYRLIRNLLTSLQVEGVVNP